MATVYVVAFVQSGARNDAESAVQPFLLSSNDQGVYTFSVPLVPLAGPIDAVPTHYGTCAAVSDTGGLHAALPQLSAAIPGTVYAVVSPFTSFDLALHWTGLLTNSGLKVRQEPMQNG